MGQLRIIKGIPVARGLALGRVHVVRARPKVVPTWSVPAEEVDREVDRLEQAIHLTGEELRRRQSLVALSNLPSRLEQGMRVSVDGDRGTVQLKPADDDVDRFLERLARRKARESRLAVHAALPSETPDGHRFGVNVNIETLQDFDTFPVANCDGVGLLRTEVLYMERTQFTSEDEQYRLYRRVLERMDGKPVTLRTLDIGNDKRLSYFQTPDEANPALGWRGLRISLEWQDLLRVQLRAALRASAHGNLRVLFPMLTRRFP